MITKQMKIICVFCTCGCIVAIVVMGYAYWLSEKQPHITLQTRYLMEKLILMFCPPSIGLMATDNATRGGTIAIMLIVVLLNSAIYGLFGTLITLILPRRWMKPRNEDTA